MKLKKRKWADKAILTVALLVIVACTIFAFLLPSKSDSLTCKDSKDLVSIDRRSYSLCFNVEDKQPFWVYQILRYEVREVQNESPTDYVQDDKIPEKYQATALDYEDSRFVMTNLLFSIPENFDGMKYLRHQYLFSVTSPQNPAFHKGYWKKLRDRVKTLVEEKGAVVSAVVSGPLFLKRDGFPKEAVFGANQIPVPTHFFQAIAPNPNENDLEIYIVPNENIDEDIPLSKFRCTSKVFEQRTGIKGINSIVDNLITYMPGMP